MYTIKLLGPMLLGACLADFSNGGGYVCRAEQPKPNVIKYYEPGKSCYKNGIFYEKCENSPEVRY